MDRYVDIQCMAESNMYHERYLDGKVHEEGVEAKEK